MKKLALTALAGTFLLIGCSSTNDVSLGAVTSNMTPEMVTLNQRPEDVKRHMAYTTNVNWRLFHEDLGRFFYTDHPSRLNPVEIVQVSGKPR